MRNLKKAGTARFRSAAEKQVCGTAVLAAPLIGGRKVPPQTGDFRGKRMIIRGSAVPQAKLKAESIVKTGKQSAEISKMKGRILFAYCVSRSTWYRRRKRARESEARQAMFARAEAFAAALARDLERCVIANAAISRELNEPWILVVGPMLERQARLVTLREEVR